VDPLTLIVVVLVLLWVGGLGVGYTAGGLLHVLLVVAVIVFLVRVLRGERL
jgi:hypothetical protein